MATFKEMKPVPLAEITAICKLLDSGPWSGDNKQKLKEATAAIGAKGWSKAACMQHFWPSDYFPSRVIELLKDQTMQMRTKLHQVIELR